MPVFNRHKAPAELPTREQIEVARHAFLAEAAQLRAEMPPEDVPSSIQQRSTLGPSLALGLTALLITLVAQGFWATLPAPIEESTLIAARTRTSDLVNSAMFAQDDMTPPSIEMIPTATNIPDLMLTDLNGDPFSIEELGQQPTVIFFWQIEHDPDALRRLVNASEAAHRYPGELAVIGVNLWNSRVAIRSYVEENDLNFTAVQGNDSILTRLDNGARQAPSPDSVVWLDVEGRVRSVHPSAIVNQDTLMLAPDDLAYRVWYYWWLESS
ncbi:MAG: redoxin domain-containing protein [Chloroflexi bacterium]|nr:redoxin domain-containing protein [Chloroflexota bacterium]